MLKCDQAVSAVTTKYLHHESSDEYAFEGSRANSSVERIAVSANEYELDAALANTQLEIEHQIEYS